MDRIIYLTILKSNISDIYCHKHMKIKTNSDDDLEKTLNVHDVVIFIKSVFYKNCNHYHYPWFLERCSFK